MPVPDLADSSRNSWKEVDWIIVISVPHPDDTSPVKAGKSYAPKAPSEGDRVIIDDPLISDRCTSKRAQLTGAVAATMEEVNAQVKAIWDQQKIG